jgi:hypothetical protein
MAKKKGSFETKAAQIASKQGVSKERGRAILAAGARKASPKAKRRNPNLLKVSGVKKSK